MALRWYSREGRRNVLTPGQCDRTLRASEGKSLDSFMIPGRRATDPNISRRAVLRGTAVAAGAAALGLGSAGSARAADASVTATSPDASTSITMSLVGGALQWSAKRLGATVVAPSVL